MALVRCADCGKDLSPRAAACPSCGAPAHAGGAVCVVVAPMGGAPAGAGAPGPRCLLCGLKAEVKKREDASWLCGLLCLPFVLMSVVGWWWVLIGAGEGPAVGGLMPGPAAIEWVVTSIATAVLLVLAFFVSRFRGRYIFCKGCQHWQRP